MEEGLLDLVLHATVALRHHLIVDFLVLLFFLFLLDVLLNFIFGRLVLNCSNKHDQLLTREVVDIEFLRETLQESKKIRVLLLWLLLRLLLLLGLGLGLLLGLGLWLLLGLGLGLLLLLLLWQRLCLYLHDSVGFCLYSRRQLRLNLLLRERILRRLLLLLLLLVLTLSDLLLLRQADLLGIHILLNPLVCLLRIEADLLAQRGVI